MTQSYYRKVPITSLGRFNFYTQIINNYELKWKIRFSYCLESFTIYVYVPVNLSNSIGLIHSGKIPVSIRNSRFA